MLFMVCFLLYGNQAGYNLTHSEFNSNRFDAANLSQT